MTISHKKSVKTEPMINTLKQIKKKRKKKEEEKDGVHLQGVCSDVQVAAIRVGHVKAERPN